MKARSSHCCCSIKEGKVQCAAVPPSAEPSLKIGPLQDLYPDLSVDFLGHVLHDICHDGLEVYAVACNKQS